MKQKIGKKKPYWVEVDEAMNELILCGKNNFFMFRKYKSLREANQMGKRMAENLGIEFRKEK